MGHDDGSLPFFIEKNMKKIFFTFQTMYNKDSYHVFKYCYLFTHKKFPKSFLCTVALLLNKIIFKSVSRAKFLDTSAKPFFLCI